MKQLRYKIIITFGEKFGKGLFEIQKGRIEENIASLKEVKTYVPMLDETVYNAKVIDNVTGKTVLNLIMAGKKTDENG